MRQIFRTILAIFSHSGRRSLYRARQLSRPEHDNRDWVSLGLLAFIFLGLLAFLFSIADIPESVGEYLEQRNRVVPLAVDQIQWSVGPNVEKKCEGGADCWNTVKSQGALKQLQKVSLEELYRRDNPHVSDPILVVARAEIATNTFKSLNSFLTLVAVLGDFRFRRADVYWNGLHERSFFLNRQIVVPFEPERFASAAQLTFDIVFELYPDQRNIGRINADSPAFISTQHEYEELQKFLVERQVGRGRWVQVIARIVLAVFAVILFVIVDGSPESLGLALFMGFEALGLALRSGWIHWSILGARGEIGVFAFFEQMGAVMRCYFYAQMARIFSKSILPWLAVGMMISVPVAWERYDAAIRLSSWSLDMWKVNGLVTGLFGIFICGITLWHTRSEHLPWRKAALSVVLVGCFSSVLTSLHGLGIRIFAAEDALRWLTIAEANSAYLLALGAFLNISTLQNRVFALSREQVRAQEIQREMELGQEMQKTLMKLPSLPNELALVAHHEAAVYVSGDTYFADWHEESGVLTFLMNDVTGHGLQAALKATGCNIIARTVWSNDRRRVGRQGKFTSRMSWYDQLVQTMLNDRTSYLDINAMIGGEFRPSEGLITIYRANFTFPIVIEGDRTVKQLHIPNRTPFEHRIEQGNFVIFMSDGFLRSSRIAMQLVDFLMTELNRLQSSELVDGARIRDLILKFQPFDSSEMVDDRTMLIFQWVPHAERRSQDWEAAS